MNVLIEMIDSLNQPVQLLVLIGLLCWVGRMVAGRSDVLVSGHRLAAISFVSYFGYAVMRFEPASADQFLGIVIRALFAAGLALSVTWIVLGGSVFLVQFPARLLGRWRQALLQTISNARMQRERVRQQRSAQEQFEHLAPERERARQEAAAHAQLLAQAQKRRATARAQCEFLYHLYSPEIEIRFPRSKFDDFVAKYLSDRELPEDVEAHAEQLRTLMDTHVKKSDRRSRFKSLRDLTDWYRDQKAQIDLLSEGSLKASLLALLHARHSELSMQLLEELTP